VLLCLGGNKDNVAVDDDTKSLRQIVPLKNNKSPSPYPLVFFPQKQNFTLHFFPSLSALHFPLSSFQVYGL